MNFDLYVCKTFYNEPIENKKAGLSSVLVSKTNGGAAYY